jgi:hypothetical protein
VHKYNIRSQVDPENHERRQARMQERAKERSKKLTVYLETSEKEMRYKDYFETDYDPDEERMGEVDDWLEQKAFGNFHFGNYEFVEEGLSLPTPAVMGTFDRKLFNFKHRAFNTDALTHITREKRMVSRFLERAKTRDPASLVEAGEVVEKDKHRREIAHAMKRTKPYQEYMLEEAVKQYKDYYESDVEDLADFDYITSEEKAKFGAAFTDFTRPTERNKFVLSFEAPSYDSAKGVLGNITSAYRDFRSSILPGVKRASQVAAASQFSPLQPGEIDFDVLEGNLEAVRAKEAKLYQQETAVKALKDNPQTIKVLEQIDELWSKSIDEFGEAYNPPSKLK